jgi:pimeloyl-ACP methyl ester carboxylesterase
LTRPQILLVPTLTELEWRIKPLLEEWAEVASFDAPGVGDEPPADAATPTAIVNRGIEEIERRGWEKCVVVGDEYGVFGAVTIATERPDDVEGIALGHACLSFSERGERPGINGDVMGAMRKLFDVDYRTYARHLTQVTQGAYDEETTAQYIERVPHDVSRGYQSELIAASKGMEPLVRSVEIPLLLAKHDGCLGWTDEGWEDAVAAFPEAQTMETEMKPSCSPEFAEALRSFCAAL